MSLGSPSAVPTTTEPGLWRNRSFWVLALGTAISLAGDALYALVIPLWVVRATGSSAAYAAVSATASVITLLVSPLAGTFADRTDRRRLMIGADVTRALIVAALSVFMLRGSASMGQIIVAASLLSIAASFFSPAYAAALTGLVHPADLTQALSTFQLLRQVIMLSGPALAGLIVSRVGDSAALGLDAATFVISAVCVCLVRLNWAPRPPRAHKPFWRDFMDGITTLTGNRVLIRTVLLSSGVNLVGGFFAVLLPVVAIRDLRLTAAQYGLFNTVNPAGVVLGMALLSVFAKRVQHRGRFMLWSLLSMGVTNALMGVASDLSMFLVLLFLGGVTFGVGNVMFAGLYRELVRQEHQGRFFGMLGTLSQILFPIGITLAGVLGDIMSAFWVLGIGGILIVALSLWGFATPGLRDLR